jgi:hypothetical protein
MGKRNPILTAALSVSLIAHGLGLSGMAWWYIQHNRDPKTKPIDKYWVWVNEAFQQKKAEKKAEEKSAPPADPPKPPPAAKEQPPPPAIKPKIEKPTEKMRDDSGEADGKGIANRSSPGEKPMQAPMGAEQADLMKFAKNFADALLPASSGKPQGDSGEQQKSPKAGVYNAEKVEPKKAPVDPEVKTAKTVAPSNLPGPNPKVEVAKATAAPPPSGVEHPTANVPLSESPTIKSVLKEIRGHEATVSDTESLAYSSTNGGIFRAGSMKSRNGLKVKMKLAIYGEASVHDAGIVGDAVTLIGVKVDADGNPLDVQILQSSGSENIDQDRKNAIWMSILSPQKDKDGRVIDDIWVVAYE